jgi:serine/threonine-protein kinase
VLDFGIVKTVNDKEDMGSMLTGKNVIHGTPAFMSPEQALGNPLDGRADIYSLGCVAYWLLTGKLVFTAETPTGVLMKHIQSPAAAPSAGTELPIPAALDRIVLSCLEKDPAQRPQSARELAGLLAQLEVAEAWTEQRRRDWWNRHRPLPATNL